MTVSAPRLLARAVTDGGACGIAVGRKRSTRSEISERYGFHTEETIAVQSAYHAMYEGTQTRSPQSCQTPTLAERDMGQVHSKAAMDLHDDEHICCLSTRV